MMFGNAESETGRVEAFSDGVLAVIITIMALELRAPVGGSSSASEQRPSRSEPLGKAPMSLVGAMRQHG